MSAFAPSPAADGGNPYAEDPSLQAISTPIWREAFAGLDWLSLRFSPLYWGCGAERGNGEPVVLVPGFLASDVSLIELYGWLGRVGYKPYFSSFGRNADCPDHLADRLLDSVIRAHEETGQRVRLVGHSLGGMLARSVALDFPEHVAMVVSLGSPFRETVKAHPVLIAAAATLRQRRSHGIGSNIKPTCFSGHCTCPFVKNMLAPDDYRVAHYAIYSRFDGVVDWRNCREEDPALNDEVDCTHIGMAWHPGVYRALARRLAEAV